MPVSSADPFRFFSTIQPFSSLSKEDLQRVAAATSQKVFERDETIFNEGDSADSVWVIFKGRVQVFKYTSDGKPFAIESLGAGEMFGTLCRLGANGRSYPCTAVAAERSTIFKMLDRTFLDYYMKSPGMVRGLCSLCADRLKDVQDLRCMGQEPVHVRVATILARLYQVHGATLPFTKREISELIGVTVETTFRTLGEFQKKGLVASSRGKIQIRKPVELKNIVEGG